MKAENRARRAVLSLALGLAGSLLPAFADQDCPGPSDRKVNCSPYPEKTFPNQMYFGDTHLHTSDSSDAGRVGRFDAKGAVQEKVYDVVWSGDRKPGADGKLPPVGNTVDVATATWSDTIGSPELVSVWKDPDFDPALKAFSYGRVIEIPTPRWTCYDALRYGITLPKKIPLTETERAYTSPIWYNPGT